MRTITLALTLAALTAWSIDSRAQLQPPPPMQTPPGATPAQPAWGFPTAQPQQLPLQPIPNATVQQLNAGDASGSFRGLEVAWANVGVGGGYVALPSSFGSSTGGPAFDLGFGGRFVTWTLGLRARVMPTSSFTLVQAMLEAGYHLPMGAWDPYIDIRGGYATALVKEITALSSASSTGVPNPHGLDLGAAIGDDYYLSALLSLGLDVSFDAMFLSRGELDNGKVVAIPAASGVAFVVVGSAHLGLHFDL